MKYCVLFTNVKWNTMQMYFLKHLNILKLNTEFLNNKAIDFKICRIFNFYVHVFSKLCRHLWYFWYKRLLISSLYPVIFSVVCIKNIFCRIKATKRKDDTTLLLLLHYIFFFIPIKYKKANHNQMRFLLFYAKNWLILLNL